MKKEDIGESREERFLKSIVNTFIKNKDLSGLEVTTDFGGIRLVRSNASNPIGFSISSDEYIEDDEYYEE